MGNLGIYEIAYPNIKHPLCTENNPSLTVEKVKSARKPLFKV